jgi:hypothetical protein
MFAGIQRVNFLCCQVSDVAGGWCRRQVEFHVDVEVENPGGQVIAWVGIVQGGLWPTPVAGRAT